VWFGEQSKEFVGRKKWAKLRWLQDPGQNGAENLDNVGRKTCRHLKKE